MKRRYLTAALVMLSISRMSFAAEPVLIAIGSINGQYEDFATQTAGRLANNVPGNRLGGIGSGLAHLGGDWFVAIPDRGPNAVPYNSCMDDTVSYINRFHTVHLSLSPSDPGSALPFTLTPMLAATTLLSSRPTSTTSTLTEHRLSTTTNSKLWLSSECSAIRPIRFRSARPNR